MKIVYFFTNLGLTGGPMVYYNFMNGLIQKGHEIYVVTTNEAFKWYTDAYRDHVYPSAQASSVVPDQANYLRAVANKVISRTKQYIPPRVKEYLKQTLQRITMQQKQGSTREIITQLTDRLIANYKKLAIDCDVLFASHIFTADAVYKLRQDKIIIMHNMHFEELMFNTERDRAEISMLSHLPFNHIVNSKWLLQMFKFNYGINAKLITPGIDMDIFYKPLNKLKFTSSGKIKLITYCDPHRKFKGAEQQIQILKRVTSISDDIEILIYGSDPETDLFPYTFLGWLSQQDLASYYSRSHILFSSSWYESFPLPPVEAMASGCSVVAGRYGTEEYLFDDDTGKIIDPFKIEESAQKIIELASQRHVMMKMAERGQSIAEMFAWDKKIEEMNNFLTSVKKPNHLNMVEIQSGIFTDYQKIMDY
jgi:glycosyltransferase involved in cell wall biosynthesis